MMISLTCCLIWKIIKIEIFILYQINYNKNMKKNSINITCIYCKKSISKHLPKIKITNNNFVCCYCYVKKI